MSITQFLPTSARAVLTVLLLALAGGVAPSAMAQVPTALPPERMSYQGFLADGNGVALATNAPKNYDVIFRVFNDASATAAANLIWSEQQSVTVDKGYFSILLGEGTQVGVEPNNPISSVFTNSTASDRFVEMTVKGIGTGGTDVKILPRLRLLSSPYAYLARHADLARSATKVVSSTGADLLTSSGTNLTIAGTLSASTINAAGLTGLTASQIPNLDGSKITSGVLNSAQIPNLDASKISSGTLNSAQIPNLDASKINSGTLGDGRLSFNVAMRNAGNTFSGGQQINGGGLGINTYGYSDALLNIKARNSDNVIMSCFRRDTATGGSGGGSECVRFEDYGTFSLNVMQGGATKPGGGSWGVYSDLRLKHDVKDLKGSLERLLKLRSVTFEYNDVPEAGGLKGTQIGFVAQEVEGVFPAWVGESGQKGYKSLNISGFESLTVQALRELRAEKDNQLKERDEKIAALDKRVAELESKEKTRVATLEQEVAELKKLVAQLAQDNQGSKVALSQAAGSVVASPSVQP